MARKFKITITKKCPIRCDYCFVDKNNQVMDYKTAKAALDFLLENGEKGKMLLIFLYGGEPLLYPELMKKIITYAFSRSRKRKRNIFICIGTNGMLLTKKMITFFKRYDIGIALSLGGDKKTHDKFRHYANKKGTFDEVLLKLELLKKEMSPYRYYVAYCLHPEQVDRLYDNFVYLHSLGIRSFRIEWIYDLKKKWGKREVDIAVKDYIRIWKFVMKSLKGDEPIYIVNFMDFINSPELDEGGMHCKINTMEISPSGNISLSSFLNSSKKNIVGNVFKGLKKDLFTCQATFENINNQICHYCKNRHIQDISEIVENLGMIEDEFKKISERYLTRINSLGKEGEAYLANLQKYFPF
jgi:uncharacterized protein